MDADEEAARAFNARTAERYDAAAYTPQADPALDLTAVLGLGLLYGCEPAKDLGAAPDVLDLGCGVGVQLERAAGQTSGRLVGTDISTAACEQARGRLKAEGERASILHTDLLDLTPEALGTFDVIYCVGVLYVVPPPVRRRLLQLIAGCLKPGGVAVLSYYAGGLGLMRAELNRMIRAAAPGGALDKRLEGARAFLNSVAGRFQRNDPGLPAQTAHLTAAYTDAETLLHESLCEEMTALHTTALAESLEGEGVRFLSYVHGLPSAAAFPARERALGADIFDFAWGGYRYGLFGKPAEDKAPDIGGAEGWRTPLTRQPGPTPYRSPAAYGVAGGGQVPVALPLVQAALDEMARGTARRQDILAGARRRLTEAGVAVPAEAETQLDAELSKLWQMGGVAPLWLGDAGPA